MAQMRGNYGVPQSSFGAPSGDMSSDPSPLDAIREQTSKIEDFLDTMSDPIKPYVVPLCIRPRLGALGQLALSARQQSGLSTQRASAKNLILQISASNWSVFDCGHLFGRCAENHHTME